MVTVGMSEYVFTREHTLDRVKYQAGDALGNNRKGEPYDAQWLMAQGVPLRATDQQSVIPRVTDAPIVRPAPLAAAVSRPQFIAPASPRFKCCGWK